MSRVRSRPEPRRIRFHGQELDFSDELKFLVADEAAYSLVPEDSVVRLAGEAEPDWERVINMALTRFDRAGRGRDAYEWFVSPSTDLDNLRPIELVQRGLGAELIEATDRHLSRLGRRRQP